MLRCEDCGGFYTPKSKCKCRRIRAAEVAVIEIAEKWQEFMCSDAPDVPSLDYFGEGARINDRMAQALAALYAPEEQDNA